MKKTLAVLLAAAAALNLSACGSTLGAQALAGSWTGDGQDISSQVTAMLENDLDAELQEIMEYVRPSEIYIVRELTLNTDGSFTLTPDGNDGAVDAALNALRHDFDVYLEVALAESYAETGYTESDYRAALGVGEDESLLTALGIDADALFTALNYESRLSGLTEALSVSGAYRFSGSKLTLTAEDGGTAVLNYDSAADALTVAKKSGESMPDCPLSFRRSD